MVEYFLKRYKTKSESELRHIVHHKEKYQEEAYIAAKSLLENKDHLQLLKELKNINDERKKTERESDLRFDLVLDPRPYLRNVSHHEVITVIALSTFLHAMLKLSSFYSEENFLEEHSDAVRWFLYLIVMLANNIIYRFERKQNNNYIGRVLNTFILIVAVFLVRDAINFVFNLESELFAYSLNTILGWFFLSVIFETSIAFLKVLFRYLKWDLF